MTKRVVGIDLGGTGLRMGVVAEDGTVEGLQSQTHGGFSHPMEAVERLARMVEGAAAAGGPVDAVGVGVAAWVERDTGFIARAPNLGWIDVPFGELLRRRLKLPVVVHNDLKAIAWGEYRFGAGVGARTLLVVYVGTGVGAAVIAEGNLLVGARGFGGEIGHIKVGPDDGPLCGCGRRGCLEAYVGGHALALKARQSIALGRISLPGPDPGSRELTAADLEELSSHGDAEAQAVLEGGGTQLGRVLGSMVTFLNPDTVLMGGGVWDSSDVIKDAARIELDLTSHPDLRKSVRIVEGRLGSRAGVIGAADLARRNLGSH
ncbi:MAG: Glucokinase [Myxococcaceae bacterium]|nr:Glucokinase [Myxococcaceae bacterium]